MPRRPRPRPRSSHSTLLVQWYRQRKGQQLLLRLLHALALKHPPYLLSLTFFFEQNSTYTLLVFSDGGTPRQTPRPSSSVRNVTTVIVLLAPRLSASPPTQVRPTIPPQHTPPSFFWRFPQNDLPPTSPPLFIFFQSRLPLYPQSCSRS